MQSPLQIQGTRHFFNVCNKGWIRIGCLELSFEQWKQKFEKIGKSQEYTPAQIEEYGLYIELAIKLYTGKETGNV